MAFKRKLKQILSNYKKFDESSSQRKNERIIQNKRMKKADNWEDLKDGCESNTKSVFQLLSLSQKSYKYVFDYNQYD